MTHPFMTLNRHLTLSIRPVRFARTVLSAIDTPDEAETILHGY
jgi:hypothetical protein